MPLKRRSRKKESVFVIWKVWKQILTKSHDKTKQQNGMRAQRRLRSAWVSAQSDQNLRCPPEESLGPYLPIERTAKTLIRLGGCPGWSESSLGPQSFYWFLSWVGSNVFCDWQFSMICDLILCNSWLTIFECLWLSLWSVIFFSDLWPDTLLPASPFWLWCMYICK